jgi:hypothetical protein
MIKKEVFGLALSKINLRISELEILMAELKESLENESKSSAGDKHETGRAMVQLEQEKLSKQMTELLLMRRILEQINPSIKHVKIGIGSLVETTMGWYFISVGLGPIEKDGKVIFVLNPQAPLGQKLVGKKEGESIDMNGKMEEIHQVY